VLHQQPRRERGERLQLRLERPADERRHRGRRLLPRHALHPVHRRPQLPERVFEIRRLLRITPPGGQRRFDAHRIVEVFPNPAQLRPPRR
ncbi:MAG: hypothetical protein ACK56I_33585, partial [bacterium]